MSPQLRASIAEPRERDHNPDDKIGAILFCGSNGCGLNYTRRSNDPGFYVTAA